MAKKWQLATVALAGLLLTGKVEAQKVSIGARGGLSVPNLTAGSGSGVTPLNEGYSSRLGAGFGIFTEFTFSKLFSLQPMIEYSSQGGKRNGFQALPVPEQLAAGFQQMEMPVPDYLYADYKSTAKLNYLMVPVLAKFGWDLGDESPFRLYVGAGPFVGFLLNAHQEIGGGQSSVYFDREKTQPVPAGQDPSDGQLSLPFDSRENISTQLHAANFGAEGNVGISYKSGRRRIFIEGGGNYGLVNIQKGTANGKNHAGAGTIMLGCAYDL